ncbi:hypothetical protein [Peristeroidobacter soli]|uniref:hypothetical protein n=1 Tax=Peristeroidobacter soli TaxID=2497877 RepID=UPI00101C0F80|nr:hypothetical protein [Peristeroidobacter soli]
MRAVCYRIIALILGLTIYAVASAADFHVRPATECANNGDGTTAACAADGGMAGAFRGFTSINWSALQPGDSLYIVGQHNAGLVVGRSGTSARRITIRGDKAGAERGIIDGGGTLDVCLTDNNHSYLSILNLEVGHCLNRGLQFDNGRGVDRAPMGGAFVNNVFVHDIAGGGSYPTCIWGYGHQAVIENSRIQNCGDDGLWWVGDSVGIRNNAIAGVGIGPVETGDCIQLAGVSRQFNISRNRCDHLAANEKHCIIVAPPDGTVFDATAGGRIEENTCFMPPYDGLDTKGITVAEPNVLIARNFVTGARIGIAAAGPYIVANVVTQFHDVGILATGQPGPWALVASNTIVAVAGENGQVAPAYCLAAYETSGEFVNNIVSGCNVGMAGYGYHPNNVWDTNLSWRNASTYEFGQPALNTTLNTLTANPNFAGTDPRSARSWAVLTAVAGKSLSGYIEPNVGTPFVFDFLKNLRPETPAVGAYEPDSK